MKQFYLMQNIGRAKYVVNFHDGEKTHSDGSKFFDVKIFNNKNKLVKFIKQLTKEGYTERGNK